MHFQCLLGLQVEVVSDSFVCGRLFIDPDSNVVRETFVVMTGWQKSMSYSSNINFFGKFRRFEILLNLALAKWLLFETWVHSWSFLAINERCWLSEDLINSECEISVSDSVKTDIDFVLHTASVIKVGCFVHHFTC